MDILIRRSRVVEDNMWISALLASCIALRADELSFRDQLLLIHISETVPAAGTTAVSSMAGTTVDVASLGPFTLVRGSGGGIYVLDPNRAFNRWGETGVSIGGPLDSLRFYFNSYRDSKPWALWSFYGRGRFTDEEVASMSLSPSTALAWKKFRLPDAERYESGMSARAGPDEQESMGRLVRERVRNYFVGNWSPGTHVPEMGPVPVLKYIAEVNVTVPLRGRGGRADPVVLHVPINPTLPPYVGYPYRLCGGICRDPE
jgi:hypothetical protein